jgi:hypothetical protein
MDSIRSLFSSSKKDDFSARQTLTLIGLAGAASLSIAFLPGVHLLNYPFRLLLTIVHELGHGLAALITGGDFVRFVIFPDGAGLAYTAGGWRFVVIPAGYLGVALFGAGLILLGRSHYWSRLAMAIVGGAMLVFSLRYGIPSIAPPQVLNGILTTVSGVIFGGFFLWMAVKAAPGWIILLLHLVAVEAGLTAFSDLAALMGLSTRFFDAPANDARSMAELLFIPAIVWAVLWAVTALLLIGGAIWLTWLAPAKRSAATIQRPGRKVPARIR